MNKYRVMQYIGIAFILTVAVGSFLHFRGSAATKINSSKVNNLTSGLVGYWTFDGADMTATTALDRAGSNTGTLTGTPKPTPIIGKAGQALDFDGTNNYITAGSSNLGISGFTYCAWIYPRTFSGNRDIIHYGNSADNESIGFRIGGEVTAKLDVFDGNSWLAASGTTLVANNWYHVCATSTGLTDNGISDDTTNIYIGGSLDTTSTTRSYNPYIESDNLYIANQIWGSGKFDGKIDEVRVYNRALSASEITELYQQGQTKINASQDGKLEDSLIGFWTFDGADTTATTVTDKSSSNRNGTLTGATKPNPVIGKIGQGLNFNGSTSYVNVAGFTQWYQRPLSYGAWIKLNAAPVGDRYVIYKSGEFYLRIGATSVGCKEDNSGQVETVKTITLVPGQWYHIFCSIKAVGGGSHQIYINGADSSATAGGFGASPTGETLKIGGEPDYYGIFNGQMDEVRIYNKTLSQSEVIELYQQGQTKINASQTNKLTNGLVGYWPLDGVDVNIASPFTVTDRSGFSPASNGTLSGTTKPAQAIGKIGQGLDFNGTGYIAVPSASGTGPFDVQINDRITVSLWFKADSFSGYGGYNVILSKDDGGDNWNRGYSFFYEQASSKLTFWINNWNFSAYKTFTNDSNWHHLVGIYDGSNVKIYIDTVAGTPSATASVDIRTTGSTDLRIGSSGNGSPYYFFDGKIDEVRVYNRALSASEVTELYNMGR